MKTLVPPNPPTLVGLGNNDESWRLRLRLQQVSMTTLTVVITAWCVTLGSIPAIVSIMVAKHVLVAILIAGLDADSRPAVGSVDDVDVA
jgi:hypothetical protein